MAILAVSQLVCCFFFFTNLVPTAAILGGPDLHVDKGSTINLTCAVKYSPEPPAYIFWYHHEEVSANQLIAFVRHCIDRKLAATRSAPHPRRVRRMSEIQLKCAPFAHI